MRQAALSLLIKDNGNNKELLLAMKKRGFGVGRWNGAGGKFDSEKDKDIIETAIRETKEEIGITPKNLNKVAILRFLFPKEHEDWNQDVHVFLIKDWDGELSESEEMLPKWFDMNNLPFNKMWDDDKYWLPKILEGKKIKAKFIFNKEDKVIKYNIKVIKEN